MGFLSPARACGSGPHPSPDRKGHPGEPGPRPLPASRLKERRNVSRSRIRRLNDVAVLSIAFGLLPGGTPWPCEVGLAFCDGREALCWLVEPETRWAVPGSGQRAERLPEPGRGMPPGEAARELSDVAAGLRVYAESHLAVNAWLRRLSGFTGVETGIEVRDMRLLVVPPGSDGMPDRFDIAFQRSRRGLPETSRAVVDAMRHAMFLRELRSPD